MSAPRVDISVADLRRTYEPGTCASEDCPCRRGMEAPWWDELSEYPSPLDVKRLRQDATQLLVAARHAFEALRVAIPWAIKEPADTNPNVLALDAAIAKAEGR